MRRTRSTTVGKKSRKLRCDYDSRAARDNVCCQGNIDFVYNQRMENFERSNLLVCAFDEATASRSKLVLRPLILEQGTILCELNDRLRHVYFPMTCVLSSISILRDGTAVETAVAGREGAFGLLTVLGSSRISARCQVQIAGKAMRMEAEQFTPLFHRNETVRQLTMAY